MKYDLMYIVEHGLSDDNWELGLLYYYREYVKTHVCLFTAKVVETKKRHYGSTNIGRIST